MDYWKNFWNQQDSPLHESMTEESYSLYAKELLLILESIDKNNFDKVLEIGCGDGSFYDYMGFKKTTYKGFDISESLINLFKKKHADVELQISGLQEFNTFEEFDLIFSNGVIQYISPEVLSLQIEKYINLLNPKGVILFSNIPCDKLSYNYYLGKYENNYTWQLKKWLNSILSPLKLTKSTKNMGFWYPIEIFHQIAIKNNCKIRIFGGLFYPYRFSVTIEKND